tara:strand:- start:154 stop:1257 length:1104 start_codon:yes stop_codon:yes gene_type:complete
LTTTTRSDNEREGGGGEEDANVHAGGAVALPEEDSGNDDAKKMPWQKCCHQRRTSSSAVSNNKRATTPFGTRYIDRPECTLRRRANVSYDARVKETLTKLDEERREAEKRGEFEKCNELSLEIEREKREEEKRRANAVAAHHQKVMVDAIEVRKESELDLKKRHEQEREQMNESLRAESEKLKEKKSACFEDFEKECNATRSRAQKRKPKARAKELCEIRKIQDALMKQKKYLEANEVRQKGDEIERKARNETNRAIEKELLAKKLKLKVKFEREEKQMKSKQNCSAKVLRRRHEEELAALEIKFRGIFGGLENVSKVEMREMNTKMNANTSSTTSNGGGGGGGTMLRPNLNCANSSGSGVKAHFAC